MLNKPVLIEDLVAALSNPSTVNNVQTVAEAIGDAIEKYVKSGTVVGVCPSGGGPLTEGKVE